jgi:hypothetical protein
MQYYEMENVLISADLPIINIRISLLILIKLGPN